jgi:hypothetical protein
MSAMHYCLSLSCPSISLQVGSWSARWLVVRQAQSWGLVGLCLGLVMQGGQWVMLVTNKQLDSHSTSAMGVESPLHASRGRLLGQQHATSPLQGGNHLTNQLSLWLSTPHFISNLPQRCPDLQHGWQVGEAQLRKWADVVESKWPIIFIHLYNLQCLKP